MQALDTLIRGGYAVSLRTDDGIVSVNVQRTATTAMSAQLAAPFLLAVMRDQDAALSHYAGMLHKQLMDGLDDEVAIAEYNVCIGQTTTSDGLRWLDVLRDYRAERAIQMMRRSA